MFGIAVPGLTAGGSRIQRLRSSWPLLGTRPAAIVDRLATPPRLGPMAPVAPGTPGTVWQPPQPFCCISVAPWATRAGSGVGPVNGFGVGAGEAEPQATAITARLAAMATRRLIATGRVHPIYCLD